MTSIGYIFAKVAKERRDQNWECSREEEDTA